MFSNINQIRKRTPQNGTDRESYLSLLVDEYLNTNSYDAKSQILANLANFGYDPINYTYIRDVGVLDTFLYVLNNDSDEKLIHFASAGVCNVCIDPVNAEYILKHGGLASLKGLLGSTHHETVANAITILMYLCNDQTKSEITDPSVIDTLKSLKHSEDLRVANLANVFLRDVCLCD